MSDTDFDNISIIDRLNAFDKIKLAPANTVTPRIGIMGRYDDEEPFVPQEGEKHASAAGSSLLTFEDEMSSKNTEIVETATFFAQRAANFEFDKENDIVQWYKLYTQTLSTIGWNLRSYQFQEITTNSTSVSVDQMAVRLMAAAATGGGAIAASLLASFKESLTTLSQSEKPLKVFDKHTMSNRGGGFQMMPCGETKSGLVKVLLNCSYFASKVNKGKVLFVSWNKSDIRMYGSAQLCTVSPTIYGEFNKRIQEMLGARRQEDFEKIKI